MAESAGLYRNVIQATEEFGELAHRFLSALANHLYPRLSRCDRALPIDRDQLSESPGVRQHQGHIQHRCFVRHRRISLRRDSSTACLA